MTPLPHCIHEKVCVYFSNRTGRCNRVRCEYRSRPAPSPSELAAAAYQAGIECGREEGAAQSRNQTLDELSLPRDAVLRFSRIMETKLRENDGIRDGWEECDPVWLFERAEEEMKELKNEIQMYMNHSSLSPKWLSIKERVQREAADVANFCMMISDNIESLHTGGEP